MQPINMAGFSMNKDEVIESLINQWIKIAEKDLLTAKQGLKADVIITNTICFHCQQAAEKFLKAFLIKNQIEFTKTHNIMVLINLCSEADKSFKSELSEADILTDYAVEIRYPGDWYEPTIEEAKEAYEIALKVKEFVLGKLKV